MASLFDRIYAKSPVWFQNAGISAYGYLWHFRRFGGDFEKHLAGFRARESYSFEDWAAFQERSLQELLRSAQHVPYYSVLFRGIGLTADELSQFKFSDLTGLPLLEKNAIRENPPAFLDPVIGVKKTHPYQTSGTTGTPLEIRFTNDTHRQVSAAYEARVRYWAGLNRRMSRAMIGGRLVVPTPNADPPFWRINMAERQIYFSAFHISPNNVPAYVAALNKYRPEYLVGYASAHFFLARMINEQRLQVHSPRAILTSSEKLTGEMRVTIAQAYNSKVYDGYSGVENCCLISECEQHRLHISPDVGIVELIDESGAPALPGQPGEIVATGFLNHVQPLIRYRTGDIAVLSKEICPCGRQMPVIEDLVGRLEDVVIGHDGRETVRFHGIFTGIQKIQEGQIIQEELASFRIRLVVDSGFGQKEKDEIAARFRTRLGDVELVYEFVQKIERTARGKFRAVISKVSRRRQGEEAGLPRKPSA